MCIYIYIVTVLINNNPEWSLYFLSFIFHYRCLSVLPNCLLRPKLQLQSLSGDPADRPPDSYITLMASPRSSTHVWCNVFSTRWNSTALYSKGHEGPLGLHWAGVCDKTLMSKEAQHNNGQACTSSHMGIKSVVSLFPTTERQINPKIKEKKKQVLLLWQVCESAFLSFLLGLNACILLLWKGKHKNYAKTETKGNDFWFSCFLNHSIADPNHLQRKDHTLRQGCPI